MKNSILIGAGICLFIASAIGQAVEPSADAQVCISKLEVKELLDDIDIKDTNSEGLKSLESGKIFYEDASGRCIPTYETYLIGRYHNRYLSILSVFNGHTPKVKLHELQNEQILLLYYSAGANQYYFEAYKFTGGLARNSIELIPGTPVASNMKDIEVTGDTVTVKNSERLTVEMGVVITDTYRYQDNAFVLVKSERKEVFE